MAIHENKNGNATGAYIQYSKKYRLHAVKLYHEYSSSSKVIRILEREARNGKWSYDTVPTAVTILKWVRKYDVDYETEEDIQDPVRRYDIEMLGLIKAIQIRARKSVSSMKFRSMSEIVAALTFCDKTRRGITNLYKDKEKLGEQAEKYAKNMKLTRRHAKKIKEEISLASIEAIDFLAEKEKRGIV